MERGPERERDAALDDLGVAPPAPLFVHCRRRLQEGEIDIATAAALAMDFVAPTPVKFVE